MDWRSSSLIIIEKTAARNVVGSYIIINHIKYGTYTYIHTYYSSAILPSLRYWLGPQLRTTLIRIHTPPFTTRLHLRRDLNSIEPSAWLGYVRLYYITENAILLACPAQLISCGYIPARHIIRLRIPVGRLCMLLCHFVRRNPVPLRTDYRYPPVVFPYTW